MSQQRFNFGDRGKRTIDRSTAFDRDNLMAARKILQDPARYRGLTLEWARLVIARLAPDEAQRGSEEFNEPTV